MAEFIADNIISETGLTASTANITTISATTISGTTFFGNGSNLTNVPVPVTLTSSQDEIVFKSGNTFSGLTSLEYSGDSLLVTGTSLFNGNFFVTNSSSAKLRIQWFGTTTAGASPGIVWTNMPLGQTTWLHQTSGTLTGDATYIVDLTEYTECRFFFSKQIAGTASSLFIIQFSIDNVNWNINPLATNTIGTGTGVRDTGWTSIPVAARTFVYIRLIGAGGNGTADPRFSPPTILFR